MVVAKGWAEVSTITSNVVGKSWAGEKCKWVLAKVGRWSQGNTAVWWQLRKGVPLPTYKIKGTEVWKHTTKVREGMPRCGSNKRAKKIQQVVGRRLWGRSGICVDLGICVMFPTNPSVLGLSRRLNSPTALLHHLVVSSCCLSGEIKNYTRFCRTN